MGKLLETPAVRRLRRRWGDALITELLREDLARLRAQVVSGELDRGALNRAARPAGVASRVEAAARELTAPRPRSVINATGVVVHTNLGRSVLGEEAARRVAEAATAYMDLEYDLARGRRGHRMDHLAPLMSRLLPGHEFLVVNNNAAALMLALRALARRREVVISRGELVEIGGSFRVPDIMAASGARLREVGTTNRTRLTDYAAAIGARTGLLLKVHTSNFRIVGFTEETSVNSLAELAKQHSLPLVVDWGSGDMIDLGPWGIADEIPVRAILAQGADLVTFSGDKLFGGPQAGFLVGRTEIVARVRRDPLARVCRLDRLLIGAVHATLSAYVRGRELDEVPTLRMLSLEAPEIGRRARRVAREVGRQLGKRAALKVVDGVSKTGGGSSPTGERPTRLLAVRIAHADAGRLERRLRAGEPPVIGRVQESTLLLDLRTVHPSQDATLAERLTEAILAESSV